jgi:hypothetical protein
MGRFGHADTSYGDHHGDMKQADPSLVVQQLMFNRILALLQSLRCEHVTVSRFDPNTGTVEGSLAGVNFVVNVSLRGTKP